MDRPAAAIPERGFTLAELAVVLAVVGILAVVVVPRFADRSAFDERGFHDAVKAGLQHARRAAVASRRHVCVGVSAGSGTSARITLARDTTAPEAGAAVSCTVALPIPGARAAGGCAGNEICAPGGVVLGGSNVIFDPLGRPVDAARNVLGTVTPLTVSNQPDITIQPESGLVR